jgi:hypothetical protein
MEVAALHGRPINSAYPTRCPESPRFETLSFSDKLSKSQASSVKQHRKNEAMHRTQSDSSILVVPTAVHGSSQW